MKFIGVRGGEDKNSLAVICRRSIVRGIRLMEFHRFANGIIKKDGKNKQPGQVSNAQPLIHRVRESSALSSQALLHSSLLQTFSPSMCLAKAECNFPQLQELAARWCSVSIEKLRFYHFKLAWQLFRN